MTASAERNRWHTIGSFTGPDRTYQVGVLGAMEYLLSQDGEPITAGFHEFLNPFPDLDIAGKRYFVAKLGAISHILVIDPDGGISDLMKEVSLVGDLGRERPLEGFHEVSYDHSDDRFVGTLGSGKWFVDPYELTVTSAKTRYADEFEPEIEEEQPYRRPFPIGLLLLLAVVAAALYFGSTGG